MEARMKTIAAGPDINLSRGDIVSGDRAQEFVGAGFAHVLAAPIEAAAVTPPEIAVAPAAKHAKSRASSGR